MYTTNTTESQNTTNFVGVGPHAEGVIWNHIPTGHIPKDQKPQKPVIGCWECWVVGEVREVRASTSSPTRNMSD